MISADEIRRTARQMKLSAGVVEKDYTITWLLKGIYSKSSKLRDTLAFKGGTAIRKIYFPETWRFSEDLDFTVVGQASNDQLRSSLEEVFTSLLTESGVSYTIESWHATPGAVICNVQFVGPLGAKNRIKHDITVKEKMVIDPKWQLLKTSYSDLRGFRVYCYSLLEILVEKIRSIMQRGYSRDYYDVWRLMNESSFDKKTVKELLIQKCVINGVKYEPKLIFNSTRMEEARAFWEKGLGYLTKGLPSFDRVVKDLRDKLDFLKQ